MCSFPVKVPVWALTIAPPTLQLGDIHIWRADLDQPDELLSVLAQVLSPDERERVERLRFDHHRRRAIASRGILRSILSCYLNGSADEIQFCYSPKGKPTLLQTANPQALSFNVTHSENLALYAIAVDTLIGVDVEFQKPVSMLPQLIERYFSPKEQMAIAAQPPKQQESWFYYYWTAKEALTKATGQGISDLSTIELDVTSQAVIATYHHLSSEIRWQVQCLQPQFEYAAAIAYSALQPQTLLFLDWKMIEET